MYLQYPGPPNDTYVKDVSIVSKFTLGYRYKGCVYSIQVTLGYKYVRCFYRIQVHPRIHICRMYLQYPGPPQDTGMQDVSIVSRYTLRYRYVGCVYSIQVHPRMQGCRMYLSVQRNRMDVQYPGTIYDTEIWDGSIVSRFTLGYRYVQDGSIVSRSTLGYRYVQDVSIVSRYTLRYRYVQDVSIVSRYTMGFIYIGWIYSIQAQIRIQK